MASEVRDSPKTSAKLKRSRNRTRMTTLGYQPRPTTETALPAIVLREVRSGLTKLHYIQTSCSFVEQSPLRRPGRSPSVLGALSDWITAFGVCAAFVFTSTGSVVSLDVTPVALLHLTSENQASIQNVLRVQNSDSDATSNDLALALAGTWSTVTSDGIAFTLRIMAQGPSTLVGRTPDVDRSRLYRIEGVCDDAKGKIIFKLTQPSTGFTRTGSLSLTGPNSFVGIFDQRADNDRQITWSGTRRRR